MSTQRLLRSVRNGEQKQWDQRTRALADGVKEDKSKYKDANTEIPFAIRTSKKRQRSPQQANNHTWVSDEEEIASPKLVDSPVGREGEDEVRKSYAPA